MKRRIAGFIVIPLIALYYFIGLFPISRFETDSMAIANSCQHMINSGVIEAMACANAVIATDVGETRLIVTENEGIFIQPNYRSLATAIEELMYNQNKCTELGINARNKVIKQHNIENYYDYFISLFH